MKQATLISPYVFVGLDWETVAPEVSIKTPKNIQLQIIDIWTQDKLGARALDKFENKLDIFTSRSRLKPLPFMRFTFYYFLRQIYGNNFGLVDIGKMTGRDHSTVIHGMRNYKDWCATDRLLMDKHERLCIALGVDNKLKFWR